MSFKKKLLSTAMAVAMASGFAVSQNAVAVHLAEDGIGQVLLAPYYTALSGYKTKFAIYNTRSDVSVKVKVVVRSMAHSTEVRDFVCYMTPSDVCRFELVDKNGEAYLTSSDDSVLNTFGTFANTKDAPLSINLDGTNMKAVDINDIKEIGHVEIVGAYAIQGHLPGTSKPLVLRPLFDGARPATAISNNPNLVRLSGDVVIESPNGERISYRIPALTGKQGDNVTAANGASLTYPGTATPFDGRVIASSSFDVTVKQPTNIGSQFGLGGIDNIYELEYALAAMSVKGTYEQSASDNTNIFVTFPTKYRHRGQNVCNNNSWISNVHYTLPFNSDGTVTYGMDVYDNFEQLRTQNFSPLPKGKLYAEVNVVKPTWDFDSGFYDIQFESVGCQSGGGFASYDGVPTLAMTYKYSNSGTVSTLVPSAHVRREETDVFDVIPVPAPGQSVGLK